MQRHEVRSFDLREKGSDTFVMDVSHNRPSPGNELASAALHTASINRDHYRFEQRIDAMERRMRESGLPNQLFPFIAAQCVARPEWNTLRENPNSYDAVCVLKGMRPIALLPKGDLRRSEPFNDYVLRSIEQAGLVVCESPYSPDFIVGTKDRVDTVLKIIGERIADGAFSAEYHRKLGRVLGYPSNAIERFISSMAHSELALDTALIEAAFPADDDSYLRVALPSGRSVSVR